MQHDPQPQTSAQLSASTYSRIRFRGADGQRTAKRINLPPRPASPHRDLDRLSDDEQLFVRAVFAHAGLDAASYRAGPLRRRMRAALRVVRADTIPNALSRIAADPALADHALNALLIGCTSAFRDAAVFAALRETVVPQLAARGDMLRLWSVGCSSGVELLSVAALLSEANCLERSQLLGTDPRAAAIFEATRAAPAFWRSLAPELAAMQCRLDRQRFLAAAARIEWRVADVCAPAAADHSVMPATNAADLQMARAPSGDAAWHLILCRNVSIYLQTDACHALWRRLHDALAPGGTLVVGKAEKPLPASCWRRTDQCIYHRD